MPWENKGPANGDDVCGPEEAASGDHMRVAGLAVILQHGALVWRGHLTNHSMRRRLAAQGRQASPDRAFRPGICAVTAIEVSLDARGRCLRGGACLLT